MSYVPAQRHTKSNIFSSEAIQARVSHVEMNKSANISFHHQQTIRCENGCLKIEESNPIDSSIILFWEKKWRVVVNNIHTTDFFRYPRLRGEHNEHSIQALSSIDTDSSNSIHEKHVQYTDQN